LLILQHDKRHGLGQFRNDVHSLTGPVGFFQVLEYGRGFLLQFTPAFWFHLLHLDNFSAFGYVAGSVEFPGLGPVRSDPVLSLDDLILGVCDAGLEERMFQAPEPERDPLKVLVCNGPPGVFCQLLLGPLALGICQLLPIPPGAVAFLPAVRAEGFVPGGGRQLLDLGVLDLPVASGLDVSAHVLHDLWVEEHLDACQAVFSQLKLLIGILGSAELSGRFQGSAGLVCGGLGVCDAVICGFHDRCVHFGHVGVTLQAIQSTIIYIRLLAS